MFKNISSQYKLILFVSIFFTLFYNISFFQNVNKVYSFQGLNIIYISSLVVLQITFTTLLFSIFASKYTTKPILIFTLLISSFTSYFMDTYHVIIDDNMIRNSLQTDFAESSDLFSLNLVLYVCFLGILPSFVVYKIKINYQNKRVELFAKLKYITISLVVIGAIFLSFSKFYTSFFREHKPLRYSVNPSYWIYSIGNYVAKSVNATPKELKKIGEDAKLIPEKTKIEEEKKELVILVVGEAARADRFSLNGYEKETNPLLKKEDIVNFTNMYSCGTSTAQSVPCMFSIFGREDFTYKKGISTENILDVLEKTNEIDILWRDNNSDSKGVALRVDYEDYKTPKNNTICDDTECRDEGMLVGLDKYIEAHKNKDILIVLHQMGNHGPAYYKRYPKEFEKFSPVCKTNQLEECTKEEVSNAYDNAILYTDYFLSKTINFLKSYSKDYETTMLYISDHGESLGENGFYLHGIPYFMAPNAQKHVGSILWLGDGEMKEDYDEEKLKSYKDKNFSQDNLFHTLLGLFEVQTEVYKKDMDILNDAKRP